MTEIVEKNERKLNAMYESDLASCRTNKKVKGYQATFSEFINATKSCQKENDHVDSVYVDYNYPAVTQLWDSVSAIINMTSVKWRTS